MQKDFSKQLIKGKIAELIFDQMFRESDRYTVIPFGYEAIVPDLIQHANGIEYRGLLENIRNAPDFAVVSHEPKAVSLVEVKYRSQVDMDDIRMRAAKICEMWKLAHLFVATPSGFYFNLCTELEGPNSQLTPLPHEVIPTDLQSKYLGLLKEFIR